MPDQSSPAASMVTFYHDTEQNLGIDVDPAACRQMVTEFLRIEKQYGISVTYNVVGKIYEDQPELIEMIEQGGHEVAFHSYNHTYDPENYASEVARCRQLSSSVKGYRSPRSQSDESTFEALWSNGYLWSAENDGANEPYFVHKGLVRLPIAMDDWAVHTGETSEAQWADSFSRLLGERRYFAFGNHDCVTSLKPEERLRAYEEVIQTALQRKALIVNFSEAADVYRRAAVAKYYSQTAKQWNDINRDLYRTKKFKEIIRSEAEKLDKPAVADLGSAGGLLTTQLADVASVVYCVDNAPGMVQSVETNPTIKAQIGDVTDSGLASESIDFVVATRIVEYLFWPDQLADEIKRIGKLGATYLLSFPGARKTAVQSGDAPPDRIRRYFTAEEVQAWTEQIGPGRLVGIPRDEQAEAENLTEPGKHEINNWIYVGEIARREHSASAIRTKHIALSDVRFALRNLDTGAKSLVKRVPAPVRKVLKRLPYFNRL